MDPICHTLAGLAIGETGLKHRTTWGMATLVIAANVPDVDGVVFATDLLPMYYRRGWTHGVLAMVVLPIVLTGLVLLLDRFFRQRRAHAPPRADANQVLFLAYIGTLSHPFLDYLNTYGVRLLKPFSNHWFYGDALYIIDPWMYVLLGGAVVIAHVGAREGRPRPWVARAGLAFAGAYIVGMLASNVWAREVVAAGLARAGRADARFMVTPVLVNPFRREVIIDAGDRYERAFVWFDPAPHFRPAGFGVSKGLDDPATGPAMLTPLAQRYLAWSRFPFFVVDRTGGHTRVFLNDYRYSNPTGRNGWAGVEIHLEARQAPSAP